MKRHPHRSRRMFAPCGPHELNEDGGMTVYTESDVGQRVPVLVIPLTKEAVDTLQLKLAKAYWASNINLPWTSISQPEYRMLMGGAKSALAAIGIKVPRKS
jgi:hypothetical protein